MGSGAHDDEGMLTLYASDLPGDRTRRPNEIVRESSVGIWE